MAPHECRQEAVIATISTRLESIDGNTKKVLLAIEGEPGRAGLKEDMAVLKSWLRISWYFIGVIVVALIGLGIDKVKIKP